MRFASRIKDSLDEHVIHLAFQITLWFKAVFAVTEILGGIAAYFIPRNLLVRVIHNVAHGELLEDPNDLIANLLVRSAEHLSIGTQQFAAAYLASHGIVKLWLVIGLLRRRLWYYPVAMAIFGLFVLYQLYRFQFSGSYWLLLITAVDLLVIGLTVHEYRYIRARTIRP